MNFDNFFIHDSEAVCGHCLYWYNVNQSHTQDQCDSNRSRWQRTVEVHPAEARNFFRNVTIALYSWFKA